MNHKTLTKQQYYDKEINLAHHNAQQIRNHMNILLDAVWETDDIAAVYEQIRIQLTDYCENVRKYRDTQHIKQMEDNLNVIKKAVQEASTKYPMDWITVCLTEEGDLYIGYDSGTCCGSITGALCNTQDISISDLQIYLERINLPLIFPEDYEPDYELL